MDPGNRSNRDLRFRGTKQISGRAGCLERRPIDAPRSQRAHDLPAPEAQRECFHDHYSGARLPGCSLHTASPLTGSRNLRSPAATPFRQIINPLDKPPTSSANPLPLLTSLSTARYGLNSNVIHYSSSSYGSIRVNHESCRQGRPA